MEAVQTWVSKNKLASIGKLVITLYTSSTIFSSKIKYDFFFNTGALWASGIGATLVAYSRAKSPMKPSLRLIHARYFYFSSKF